MTLDDKKIALLVAGDYEDLEAWYPLLRMKEAGAEVDVIASDNVEGYSCLSKHGYSIDIDLKAAEADPEAYDGVIIPGGWAPDKMRRCDNTLEFVRDLAENDKVVASICHGGWVLASADVVEGKTLTSTPAIKDDLENAGAEWVDEEVVVDGNFITSRNPADLPAFGKALIFALAKKVCVVCGDEINEEEVEKLFYCVDCNSFYCPECAEEEADELRQTKTNKIKREQYNEKKQLEKIQNLNVDEYKRRICPRCQEEMMRY